METKYTKKQILRSLQISAGYADLIREMKDNTTRLFEGIIISDFTAESIRTHIMQLIFTYRIHGKISHTVSEIFITQLRGKFDVFVLWNDDDYNH